MKLLLTCDCGQTMTIPKTAMGKKGKCVACRKTIRVNKQNTVPADSPSSHSEQNMLSPTTSPLPASAAPVALQTLGVTPPPPPTSTLATAPKVPSITCAAARGHNSIHRAMAYGGLIGSLIKSKKRALEVTIDEINASGKEVVFVLPDNANWLLALLYSVILLVTFFMFCPSTGYIIIARRTQ